MFKYFKDIILFKEIYYYDYILIYTGFLSYLSLRERNVFFRKLKASVHNKILNNAILDKQIVCKNIYGPNIKRF